MSKERMLLDTVFLQGLLDPRDQYHALALKLLPRVTYAQEVMITESILAELGDALSRSKRNEVAQFISQCYTTANMTVINIDSVLFQKTLQLYRNRLDKAWGFTDCISFTVMQEYGLTDAMTADLHFVQAGFRALMLE
jgi:uncharacterized protein